MSTSSVNSRSPILILTRGGVCPLISLFSLMWVIKFILFSPELNFSVSIFVSLVLFGTEPLSKASLRLSNAPIVGLNHAGYLHMVVVSVPGGRVCHCIQPR